MPKPRHLPPDDAARTELHNEIHARPSAEIQTPALVVYIAVLNAGVSRAHELAHLQLLPGQSCLQASDLESNFLRLQLANCTLNWERHSEFTRYSIVQSLPQSARLPSTWTHATVTEPDLMQSPAVDVQWTANIPGSTLAAIQLALVEADMSEPKTLMTQVRHWFGGRAVLASQIGQGHSWAATEFRIGDDGFERMLLVAPSGTNPLRIGRATQRLLEMETYRLLALRGLPAAKQLSSMLAQAETTLAEITAQLDDKSATDQELLDALVSLATRVERATAEHGYRFSATRAYANLVEQRIASLREKAIDGTQTLGVFMQHRFAPAMATVEATAQRLSALSERVSRASAMLRTRVDIATEAQNQQLLEKLTRGQDLQLRLQATVEGLSIAAISYYVVSLLLYAGKALKQVGMPINPEVAVGAAIPLVLLIVWRISRHVTHRIKA